MMASIAPFWDGNETWLVMGGVGLLVAFPLAYAIVMPALYLPVIVMLLALVFRGVAFEFREIGANKALWNTAFAGGSTLAGFAQGVILGGLIQGIAVKDGAYAGGTFDWATPFALLCGLGVSFGYALLGATWLTMKTKGPVADRARSQAIWLLYAVLAFMAVVSLWTPLAFPRIRERWFSLPNFFFLWPVPLLTALIAFAGMALAAARRRHRALHRDDRAVSARLSRPRDLVISVSRAAVAHHLADRGRAGEPDLHAGRHGGAAAADPGLHRLTSTGCSAARSGRAKAITTEACACSGTAGAADAAAAAAVVRLRRAELRLLGLLRGFGLLRDRSAAAESADAAEAARLRLETLGCVATPAQAAAPVRAGRGGGVASDAAGLRARTDHAPADPQQRHAALKLPREGARHLDRQIGKLPHDLRRRPARGVGGRPDDHRALVGDVLLRHMRAIVGHVVQDRGSAGSARRAPPATPAPGRRPPPRAAVRCGAQSCRRRTAPSRRPAGRSADRPQRSRAGIRSQAPPAAAAARSARPRHSRSDTGARS